jgi:multicomponent Na+:H+ antiporter subunit D
MPVTMAAFFLGSMSIIGLPPMGGSWSKWYLALGAADADQLIFVGVLMLSSLLSIGYLMPVVGRAFFLPPRPWVDEHGHEHEAQTTLQEGHWMCTAPLVCTALGCIALFFFGTELRELLLPIVGPISVMVEVLP